MPLSSGGMRRKTNHEKNKTVYMVSRYISVGESVVAFVIVHSLFASATLLFGVVLSVALGGCVCYDAF